VFEYVYVSLHICACLCGWVFVCISCQTRPQISDLPKGPEFNIFGKGYSCSSNSVLPHLDNRVTKAQHKQKISATIVQQECNVTTERQLCNKSVMAVYLRSSKSALLLRRQCDMSATKCQQQRNGTRVQQQCNSETAVRQ
jgi:hypothetical protein